MTWEQQAGSVVSPGNGVRAWPLPTLHGPGSSGMCLRVLAVGSSHEDGLRTGPLGPCASQGFRETGTVGWGRCRDPTPRPEPVMQRTHGGACSKWGGKSLRPCLVLAAHTRVKAQAVVTCMRDAAPLLAPGSALTVCPPARLSVRLLRQVSLSVSPHLRSSASTVKALPSQGCGQGQMSSALPSLPHRLLPAHPGSPMVLGLCPGGPGLGTWETQLHMAQAGGGPDSHSVWAGAPAAPWPAHSCSRHALCMASRQRWRSGRPPARSRCRGTDAPGSSTGLGSRC